MAKKNSYYRWETRSAEADLALVFGDNFDAGDEGTRKFLPHRPHLIFCPRSLSDTSNRHRQHKFGQITMIGIAAAFPG
ncbi:MAG: hypothetical protein JSV03_02230 [Planctomycetota bacterium]|nr:MAG: hypothetical protein JSV03_02230 [Planctomycetota bacterium]